ncbi:hypothetical protein Q2T42_14295 [Leptolyngbya boryana CZ1]|uniref:Uncharacterized protein n=1 Tax=Leptolyngbya boryana CZ1 TaxID=3060204 RepID=A0AA96X105_LEPBY|nr:MULTISPECIES: hypothetical protein [Leptolyngbya]MBN8561658.1 hypothetical protein [Leptolyngbya sp. UWPOB_LEPTO1]WNZ48992.1 hypothetical protein Q2T42_14295 [Leptolyngbya boryana CZ1]
MDTNLREEVHTLAEEAFHLHLISGYGDGEYDNEYQIVYKGKPRHLPLERAKAFLIDLIQPEVKSFTQLRLAWMLLLESYRRRSRDSRAL